MIRFISVALLLLILVSCAPVAVTQSPETMAMAPTLEPAQAPSRTPSPQPSATPEPTEPPMQICSPIEGYTLEQMPGLVSNPYHPPRPGSDDPHHGVDLADMVGENRIALPGKTVQAALAGRVAAVIQDRFPFGNALIIETPLGVLPPEWRHQLAIPAPAPTLVPQSALTCPRFDIPASWDLQKQSLYILYAHMEKAPTFQQGDPVACGQPIGTIGQSGNALNPHLHFEVRAGPAGARLGSLGHYDSTMTLQEMATYCTWSISGLFQMMDPLKVLAVGN